MTTAARRAASVVLAAGACVGAGGSVYLGLVTGAVPIDLGVGRRTRIG